MTMAFEGGPVVASPMNDDSAKTKPTARPDSATPEPEPASMGGAGQTGATDAEAEAASRHSRLRKLAHELKTPLSAIVSAAEIMRDERLGPLGNRRYRDYSEDIHRTARHALEVINDMLSSRGDDAHTSAFPPREITEIDAGDLVSHVASSLAPLAQRSGLALDKECAQDLPLLIAEAVHIRQILINLFTNAARHTPSGGRILMAAHFDRDRGLVLEVTDSGTGMAPETIAQVLSRDGAEGPLAAGEAPANAGSGAPVSVTPDTDADESGFWGGAGQGIGLGIVKRLALANGGRLEIASPVPGQSGGTRVSVAFGMDRLVFV